MRRILHTWIRWAEPIGPPKSSGQCTPFPWSSSSRLGSPQQACEWLTSGLNFCNLLNNLCNEHLIQQFSRAYFCHLQQVEFPFVRFAGPLLTHFSVSNLLVRDTMSDNQRQFSNYALLASQPDVKCLVCTRHFSLDTEVTDSFEALTICRECKTTVLNDNERDVTTSTYQQRRQRRRRSRITNLESIEDAFSQQFSQLINLARQGHEADIDSPTFVRQQASYNSTPNQSQRWHASYDESDGLNYVDSVFDEIESNISFGDDGGDSDASLDQHSMMGREIVIQLDNESYMNTDTALLYLCNILWLRPWKIRKKLTRQGVKGPKPTLLYGNTWEMKRIKQELKSVHNQDTNNYISTLFPHFLLWRETYGPVFLYSTGALQILHVSHPEMVKDIGHWTPSQLGKPNYLKKSRKALFGGGLVSVNGDEWAYQRRIIAPEFFMDKIKGMIQLIVDATVPLLEAWESVLDSAGGSREIVVDDYLRNFSADVIARACFGSSFAKGEEIFCKLRQLRKAISQQDAFVGLSALWKYLPTKSNQEIRKLDEEVRLLILDVAKEEDNNKNNDAHNNLLRAIINGAQDGRGAAEAEDFIVGNCKTIYFAGHESTAVTAIWCLMLLATHPKWQERARAEALEVCQGRTTLDVDVLRRLKTLTMVIQETLRLYPPASLMMRQALTDIKLGNLDVPRGAIVQVARSVLHLDKEAWGPDADEFRPDRFANGVAAACKPSHMYVPFGHGPRTCIGQKLAMTELRVVLARLLSKFAFSPSPRYRHAPAFRLTIEPGFGMPLVVTRL